MDLRSAPSWPPGAEQRSAQELKAKITEVLASTGVLDTTKAKMQAQIIQDMRLRGQLPSSSTVKRSVTVTLSDRLMNSVVAEHLRLYGFESTLSVFLPESGLSSDPLTREDILRAWTVQVKDGSVFDRWAPDASLLHGLIQHLCCYVPHTTSSCQSDPLPDPTLAGKVEALQAHQALETSRSELRSREIEMQNREISFRSQMKQKELELKDREIELEGVRGALRLREQELRQQEGDLRAKEAELRRAALLDARALGLEEERLRAVEKELELRLKEADAALDALEAAQRDADQACFQWQTQTERLAKEKAILEDGNARLIAALQASDGERDKAIQQVKAMEEDVRRDRQQFEVYQSSVLWERENWEHERRQLVEEVRIGQQAAATVAALKRQVTELRSMLSDTVSSVGRDQGPRGYELSSVPTSLPYFEREYDGLRDYPVVPSRVSRGVDVVAPNQLFTGIGDRIRHVDATVRRQDSPPGVDHLEAVPPPLPPHVHQSHHSTDQHPRGSHHDTGGNHSRHPDQSRIAVDATVRHHGVPVTSPHSVSKDLVPSHHHRQQQQPQVGRDSGTQHTSGGRQHPAYVGHSPQQATRQQREEELERQPQLQQHGSTIHSRAPAPPPAFFIAPPPVVPTPAITAVQPQKTTVKDEPDSRRTEPTIEKTTTPVGTPGQQPQTHTIPTPAPVPVPAPQPRPFFMIAPSTAIPMSLATQPSADKPTSSMVPGGGATSSTIPAVVTKPTQEPTKSTPPTVQTPTVTTTNAGNSGNYPPKKVSPAVSHHSDEVVEMETSYGGNNSKEGNDSPVETSDGSTEWF